MVSPPTPVTPAAPTSVGNTATTAISLTGGSTTLLWVLQCISQGHMVMPDTATALSMSGMLAPFFHAIYNMILAHINALATIPTRVTFLPPSGAAK